jgi:hypothetical protein
MIYYLSILKPANSISKARKGRQFSGFILFALQGLRMAGQQGKVWILSKNNWHTRIGGRQKVISSTTGIN